MCIFLHTLTVIVIVIVIVIVASAKFLSLAGLTSGVNHLTKLYYFQENGFCFFVFSRVNCYDVLENQAPFGGFKESGIGREL